MGITIKSKRHNCDMGYGGFGRFRNIVAEQVNDTIKQHYLVLSGPNRVMVSDAERDAYFDEYDAKTERFIQEGLLTEEVANFLYQPDVEGEIDRKQAKQIYALIQNCSDDLVFGYIGRRDCATMADMKAIFSDNTKIEWR